MIDADQIASLAKDVAVAEADFDAARQALSAAQDAFQHAQRTLHTRRDALFTTLGVGHMNVTLSSSNAAASQPSVVYTGLPDLQPHTLAIPPGIRRVNPDGTTDPVHDTAGPVQAHVVRRG